MSQHCKSSQTESACINVEYSQLNFTPRDMKLMPRDISVDVTGVFIISRDII